MSGAWLAYSFLTLLSPQTRVPQDTSSRSMHAEGMDQADLNK